MDPAVVVALITSGSSVAIAVSTAVWTARQNRKSADAQRALASDQAASQSDLERLKAALQREAKEAEESYSVKAQLDRFREPLLTAAFELGDRIDNIRRRDFFAYLEAGEHRRAITIISTLFRFAQYFGRIENLYSEINILRFENAKDTKTVAELIATVGKRFATDKLDRTNGFATTRLMLWREEQRAIGELMRETREGSPPSCIGYAEFADSYQEHFRSWFRTFADDLLAPESPRSERLASLQETLAELVVQLDDSDVYVRKDDHGIQTDVPWISDVLARQQADQGTSPAVQTRNPESDDAHIVEGGNT